jgi:chromosome segregation ATPase
MRKMTISELETHGERLRTERERLEQRISHLERQDPVPTAKLKDLKQQVERLTVLRDAALEQLEQKRERKERMSQAANAGRTEPPPRKPPPESGYRRGPSIGGGYKRNTDE